MWPTEFILKVIPTRSFPSIRLLITSELVERVTAADYKNTSRKKEQLKIC